MGNELLPHKLLAGIKRGKEHQITGLIVHQCY